MAWPIVGVGEGMSYHDMALDAGYRGEEARQYAEYLERGDYEEDQKRRGQEEQWRRREEEEMTLEDKTVLGVDRANKDELGTEPVSLVLTPDEIRRLDAALVQLSWESRSLLDRPEWKHHALRAEMEAYHADLESILAKTTTLRYNLEPAKEISYQTPDAPF